MSLQLWLFTLIKSELWGISLSPISVFLFPPCSQLPLPSFLPSFLPFLSPARPRFSLLPFFSDLLSLMTETKLLDVCRPSLTEAHSLISLFLPLSHHISLCPASSFFSLFLFSSPSERGENRGERCQGQAAFLHRAAVSVSEHTRQKTYARLTGSDLTIFISLSSELP